MKNGYTKLALFAFALTVVVIILGAYTRLSDAGLGCPDWPTCYGHITVPESQSVIAKLDSQYTQRPVHTAKAWKEMIHRYFAGTLGVTILVLCVWAWIVRRRRHLHVAGLASLLLALVVFQAALGMWTVTLQLRPSIVMGHLLGGFSILSLLWLLTLRSGQNLALKDAWPVRWPRRWAAVALVVLVAQIMLGGWTSSHYAAAVCPDFPTCQGQWWPAMNFHKGFTLWHAGSHDFEYGLLPIAARTAIHVTHRLGAAVTFIVLGGLSAAFMWRAPNRRLKVLGAIVGLLLLVQVGLGISLVEAGFPLALGVAHNGNAALLLLSLVTVNAAVWRSRRASQDKAL